MPYRLHRLAFPSHASLRPRARLRIPLRIAACAAFFAAAAPAALAQVQATVKADGQWRFAIGAGGSASRGNSSSTSINVSGQAVRATAYDKIDIAGRGLYTKSEGETTAENAGLTGQYNRDFTPRFFSFGKLDALRDEPANISARWSVFGGVGQHVIRSDANTWDISAGLGYTHDSYVDPTVVSDELRSSYGRAEALLAEESTHKLTETTSLRQKLTVFPNLRESGNVRAVFDAGISVAMTTRLALTAGLTYRYDNDPGVGLKKGDTLFVTGIQFKLD